MSKRKQTHDQTRRGIKKRHRHTPAGQQYLCEVTKRIETYTERIQNVIQIARCHRVGACVGFVALVQVKEIKRKGRGRGRGRRRGRGREREREQERKREEEEERGEGNRERESERKRERQRAITDYHFEMRAANHATGLHQTHGNVIGF